MLQLIVAHPKVGVLIPIPQYPLYSATLALLNGTPVPYYLDEDADWSLTIPELQRAVASARSQGTEPRAVVVINPGNPTGACLTEQCIRDVIEFCARERLVIMADEVYQTNVYVDTLPFHSFKRTLRSMGERYAGVELVSFHSVSKGFVGECGKRGGYMELIGFDRVVREQIYKLASVSLCSNTIGQAIVDLMVSPPKPGSESYELYARERDGIIGARRRRAPACDARLTAAMGAGAR